MKIDTSKIDGFESMSSDEKVEALLKFEFADEDHSSEIAKFQADIKSQKEMIDKYSSQIAEYKKKEREGMDADAKAKLEFEERIKALEEENATYKNETTKSRYVAKYLALGYDQELAEDTAEAMIKGDMDTVFANGEKHNAALEQKFKADKMKKTPGPDGSGAGTPTPKTKEEIMKIKDAGERQKAIAENPSLFGIE